jgi:hypothetical protein
MHCGLVQAVTIGYMSRCHLYFRRCYSTQWHILLGLPRDNLACIWRQWRRSQEIPDMWQLTGLRMENLCNRIPVPFQVVNWLTLFVGNCQCIIITTIHDVSAHLRTTPSPVSLWTHLHIICRGSDPGRVQRFFSYPKRRDRLWDPPQPPVQWVPETFPGGKTAEAWGWPLLRLRMCGVIPRLPPCTFMAWAGTTLP